jgi:hypothetical protein
MDACPAPKGMRPLSIPENSICAPRFCGYVDIMNWQQFIPIAIVLAVGFVFVWRSSGSKKSECGCGGACAHDHQAPKKKENPVC